ncbi:MAG: hypothetical protein HOP12_09225, partial [Candidatus Eisenbacteria bacterium]|nr:hypothetical protein [Candidatus Eisenbacteria bacterium]
MPPLFPLLVRRRLLRRLAGTWRVAVLSAPAGFGKSTLAAQAIRGRRATWIRIGPDHRALSNLIGAWIGAASARADGALPRTRRLFEVHRDLERDLGLLTASLAAEFPPGRGERVLVLDDVHELDGATEVIQWLTRVLLSMGPRVRTLVTCRGSCPLPLARFEVEGGVLQLGVDDLAFTLAEEHEWLARVLGAPTARRVTAELRDSFRGWPAGLALAVRGLSEAP